MMRYTYYPKGICAMIIQFDLEDDNTIHNVLFSGGCDGNHKAIARLVEGMDADKVISILEGNTCGGRSTSCADQFTKGIAAAKVERDK